MKQFFLQLVSATHGQGPSSTRFIYLISHLAASFSALMASLGGVYSYCATGKPADKVYWAGVATLWMATLGAGTFAKYDQQRRTLKAKAPADEADRSSMDSAVLLPAAAMSGD